MSVETKTQDVLHYTCDGCGKQFIQLEDDEMPLGFHIQSVFWVHGGGGDGVSEVFACRSACLKKAIEQRFREPH